jgi:low affinity Fe/Cu permease
LDTFGAFARHVNRFVASPAATAGAFIIVAVWALCGPAAHFSDAWQLLINTGTTIVTFLMVFVLNALSDADNRLVGLEMKPESVAKALFDEMQRAGHYARQDNTESVGAR